MNAVDKLARKLGNRELAEKLVEAGLRDQTAIRQASDRAIVKAVGRKNLAAVRAAFPKAR